MGVDRSKLNNSGIGYRIQSTYTAGSHVLIGFCFNLDYMLKFYHTSVYGITGLLLTSLCYGVVYLAHGFSILSCLGYIVLKKLMKMAY